jgi:hypothetical protein
VKLNPAKPEQKTLSSRKAAERAEKNSCNDSSYLIFRMIIRPFLANFAPLREIFSPCSEL